MSLSTFRINQPPGTPGPAWDRSRRDIELYSVASEKVECEAQNQAESSYLWEMISAPHGVSVTINNDTTHTCDFQITDRGGYLIRLIVNAGDPDESITILYIGVAEEVTGYCLPAMNETNQDNSLSPYDGARGYEDKVNTFLRKVDHNTLVENLHTEAGAGLVPASNGAGDLVMTPGAFTDLDSAYNHFGSSPATVNVDGAEGQGDLTFDLDGAYSMIANLDGVTNVNDGFIVGRDSNYWRVVPHTADLSSGADLEADLIDIDIAADQFSLNSSTKNTIQGYTVFGAGATSHDLSANGDVVVDKLEVNSSLYADGGILLADQQSIVFGDAGGTTNPLLRWSTTQVPDTLFLGLGSTSNHVVIAESASIAHNFAHAQTAHPTMFVHSSGSSNDQWISIACVNTVGTINAGTGAAINFPTGIHVDDTSRFDANTTFYATLIAASSIVVQDWASPGTGSKLNFGTSADASLLFNTYPTNDSLYLGLDATSRTLVVGDVADISYNFAHDNQSDPTIFVHSANQSTSQWISISHNQTDGVINAGTNLRITPYTQFGAGTTSHGLSGSGSVLVSDEFEVQSYSFFRANARLIDNVNLMLGSSSDVALQYSTGQTAHAVLLGLSADSRNLVICEKADMGTNFGHTQQTNPTLFIHSANTATDEWISIAHNQTDGVINAGTNLRITPYTQFGSGTTTHGLGASGDVLFSGKLEVDGLVYFDDAIVCYGHINLSDDKFLRFGDGQDAALYYSTAQEVDTLYLGVSDDSRYLIIAEYLDRATNFGHTQQTNPTIFIHSANTATDEWISISHNQTDGVINVGTGAIKFVDNIKLEAHSIITDTSTGMNIATAAAQKIGFYGVTPVTQRAKANYNNWAAFTDVVDALVDLGLFDAA